MARVAEITVAKAEKKKTIQPAAFGVYYGAALALAIAGIINSVYLAISHYRNYTDIGYESFCAISRAINCDTVSQSPYAIFLRVTGGCLGCIGLRFCSHAAHFGGH